MGRTTTMRKRKNSGLTYEPDQPYVSYFISSSFRVQISASVLLLTASTHTACYYPHVPKLLQGTQILISIYLQRRFMHSRLSLQFQVSIALLRLRPLTSDSGRHFDFRLRFQISGFRLRGVPKFKEVIRSAFKPLRCPAAPVRKQPR